MSMSQFTRSLRRKGAFVPLTAAVFAAAISVATAASALPASATPTMTTQDVAVSALGPIDAAVNTPDLDAVVDGLAQKVLDASNGLVDAVNVNVGL
jgi:hypothetical protein